MEKPSGGVVESLREMKWQTENSYPTGYKHLSLCTNQRKFVFLQSTWNPVHLRLCGAQVCTRVRMTVLWMWFLTVDSRAAEASEGSRDKSEWPGHYSAPTNNSTQDKESFVTGAALTNSLYCVIKLANTPLPLCDTERVESPLGKPVGESPLSDKYYYGYGQEGRSIIRKLLCSFVM